MFWSHDLLGKKTALGAVWIAAHGKKLNKGRIMQVNVTEACNKVIDPEVPQALRLQAILVGGIVIVHAKQQVYLLEDAQETLRRLRAMDNGEAEARNRLTLGEGKAAAREEAITLPMDGDMRMLNLGDLFPDFPAPALSEGGTSGRRSGQLEDGLFAIPSLPDAPSEGAAPGTSKQGRRGKGRRGSKDAAAAAEGAPGGSSGGLLQAGGREEVELALEGLHRHDLELMDGPETFAVPDLDQLPGMGDFFLMGGGAAAGADGQGGALPGLQDDLLPVPDGMDYGVPPLQTDAEERQTASKRTASTERSGGSLASRESAEALAGGACAAAAGQGVKGGRRRGGAGRRRVRPTVDDIDTLQIRGRDYRDWMADRADLLVARPQRSAVVPGAGAAGDSKSALAVAAGVTLPPELQDIYMRNATLPKSKQAQTKRSKSGAAAEAGLQDAEQAEEGRERHPYQLEEAPLPQDDGGFFGAFGALDLGPYGAVPLAEAPRGYQAREDGEETEEEEDWGEGGGNAFRRRMQRERERQAAAAGQSGSEDELDVETERLRAALNSTQGTDPLFLQHLGATPASADPARPGSRLGSKRTSGGLRRDSEGGALSEKSSERRSGGRLSDLLEVGGGGEDLGAMLPAVGEDEPFLEEEEEEGSRKRRRTGDVRASAGSGLSQFELQEASGPTQELDGGPLGGAVPLQKQTVAFVSVMRSRFEAVQAQHGGDEGDAATDPCHLSFFELAARLSRKDAAKLFYQTLQARSHGFLNTHQEEPYGDITLTRGPHL